MRRRLRALAADAAVLLWERLGTEAAITDRTRAARAFARFGPGAMICFPPAALFGQPGIRIGRETIIGPFCSISAGMVPNQSLLSDAVVVIGDRCMIGRYSSIVGHLSIEIGNDVYFGPNVYVTDQNHDHTDPTMPIGHQAAAERPVRIGDGTWVGTNSVILPGVTIGRHVVVGAGSVVRTDLPDYSVAAGVPARVVRSQLPADPPGSADDPPVHSAG